MYRTSKILLTIFASDCTGWGEEGPGIPGTLGTMVTGRTSYAKYIKQITARGYIQYEICAISAQWLYKFESSESENCKPLLSTVLIYLFKFVNFHKSSQRVSL